MAEEYMKHIKSLLQKFKEGTITEEENLFLEYLLLEQIERLVLEENLSKGERDLLQEWESERLFVKETENFGAFHPAETDTGARAAWDAFAVKMEFYSLEKPLLHEFPDQKTKKHPFKPSIFMAACMVAIIAIGTYLFNYQLFSEPTVFYADGATLDFLLMDDTRVIMNEGSELIISSRFNKRQRDVKMTGEIFFDVTPNKEKPFIIAHGELTTEVKGTSFTIRNYPQLDDNSVTVNTGRVKISKSRKEIAILTPNMQLSYNNTTNKYAVLPVDASLYSGWTTGRIILKNANEKELALRVKQNYGKILVIRDHAMGTNARINSGFDRGTALPEFLEYLSLIYDLQYEVKGDSAILFKQ